MIDSPADVARKLRREARAKRSATRYWAGWRLELTFGPYELAFGPERGAAARAAAKEVYEQLYGRPPSAEELDPERSAELQRDLWHLSVSWRGSHPVEEGKRLLAELVAALGVPDGKREGEQPARVFAPDGRQSPQVTHWTWRDPVQSGA